MSKATATFVAVAPRRIPKTQEARKRPKACWMYDCGLAGGIVDKELLSLEDEAAATVRSPSGTDTAGREAEDMLNAATVAVLGCGGLVTRFLRC